MEVTGLRHGVDVASHWVLALLVVGIPLYGYAKGVKVYAAFIEGAKEGFEVAVRIIPYLVAILAAVGAFRGAGAMDVVGRALGPITGRLGLPAEVLPMAVVRPLSGIGYDLRLRWADFTVGLREWLFFAPIFSSSAIVSGNGWTRCTGPLAISIVVCPARLTA